ncbi:hypothetical protein ACIHCX_24935 [Streptomyces sp. NPDC052043]|uniref:hypothetical protein n=1 Tax=Streptomyces sp. NPDC052043 TaxID=3365684 RepID=UPI0037D5D56B
MTELSTEPVAVEAAPTTPPPPPDRMPAAVKDVKEVEHTPGGWPVVPLALTGANSTVSAVAAASLAGGPIAAMVAATGAVVLGTFTATRSRKPNPHREARRAAARAAGHNAARNAALRRGGTGAGSSRSAGGRSGSSRAGRSGGRSGSVPGQHRRGTGPAARHSSTATSGKTSRKAGQGFSKHAAGSAGKSAGRIGQIRGLRASQQGAAGSRADRRAHTTAARRAVADARRNAKAAAGNSRLGKRRNGAGSRAAPQPVDPAGVGGPKVAARQGVLSVLRSEQFRADEARHGTEDPTPDQPGIRIYAPPVYRHHWDGARWSKRHGDTPTAAYACTCTCTCTCGQTGTATDPRAVAALVTEYDAHKSACTGTPATLPERRNAA